MSKKLFNYVKIAKKLESLIMTGIIASGESLPSIRSLINSENASKTTIIKSLTELQNSGLIESKERSGFFVSNNIEIIRKEKLSISKLQEFDGLIANLINDAPNGDLTFSSAVLDISLISVNHLSAIATRAVKKYSSEFIKLMPPPGNIRTRIQIAQHLSLIGIICSPNDIVITSGDNNSLQNLIRIVAGEYGNIGIDKTCYFGYQQAIKNLNLNVHWIPSSATAGFDTKYALNLVKSGKIDTLLLNPTLSNPLGYTIPNDDREEIVKVCTNHACNIIEDDVFFDLLPPKHEVLPLKYWDKSGIVTYLGSLSKVVVPGWRIGWSLPGRHLPDIVAHMMSNNISISSPSQLISSELLGSIHYVDHIRALRSVLAHQIEDVRSLILDFFPTGTEISAPKGGYIFWITLPDNINFDVFYQLVENKKIKISNGKLFDLNDNTRSFRLCVPRVLNINSKAAIREIGLIASNNINN